MTVLGVKLRKELDHIQFSFFLSLFGLFLLRSRIHCAPHASKKKTHQGQCLGEHFGNVFGLSCFFLSTYLGKLHSYKAGILGKHMLLLRLRHLLPIHKFPISFS